MIAAALSEQDLIALQLCSGIPSELRTRLADLLKDLLKNKRAQLDLMAGPYCNGGPAGGGPGGHDFQLYTVVLHGPGLVYADYTAATTEDEALEDAEETVAATGFGDLEGRAELVEER